MGRALIFLLAAALIALSTALPALADHEVYVNTPSVTECINSSASWHKWIYVDEPSTTWTSLQRNFSCDFGCNNLTGDCNPSPIESNSNILFFLFPAASITLLYLMGKWKQDDWPIHMLLIGASIAILIIPFGNFAGPMGSQFLGAYQLLTVLLFILIFYFALDIIVKSFRGASGKK